MTGSSLGERKTGLGHVRHGRSRQPCKSAKNNEGMVEGFVEGPLAVAGAGAVLIAIGDFVQLMLAEISPGVTRLGTLIGLQ